jgi:hypothetical protein
MAALDRTVLGRIQHLQAGNDLAVGEYLDLELAAGRLIDATGEDLGRAVDRVQAFREARCQPSLDGWGTLRDGRHGDRTDGEAGTGLLQKTASFHDVLSPLVF